MDLMSIENDKEVIKMANEWINEELEEAQKDMEEKGFKPFAKLVNGTNHIEINLDERPRDTTNKFSGKPQKILVVKQEHVEGEFNLGVHPIALRKILQVLHDAGTTNGFVKLTVIKSGMGIQTKYDYKAGWE